jgi:hypothetical protein
MTIKSNVGANDMFTAPSGITTAVPEEPIGEDDIVLNPKDMAIFL